MYRLIMTGEVVAPVASTLARTIRALALDEGQKTLRPLLLEGEVAVFAPEFNVLPVPSL
jgi:hypothetical protein